MLRLRLLVTAVVLWTALPGPAPAAEAGIEVSEGVATHADGRAPIESLYASYLSLVEKGWEADVVAESLPAGTQTALPIIALRSPRRGPATWILAGIHGEEPAGPNAVAVAIADIAKLGAERPVVLMPLLNPQGYARNWRYLNVAVYSGETDGQSVGDSSHLLPSPEDPSRPRAEQPSSAEAESITAYILKAARDYPPQHSIDLHEDNLIDEGYVYSQGALGAEDPMAIAAIGVLKESGVPLKTAGTTRFGEPVAGGIVGPVVDSSIDELMSAPHVIVDSALLPGPAARTVLVFETPAAALPLARRIAAHAMLIRRLTVLIEASGPPP